MRDADFEDFSGMLDAVCSLLSRGTYAPDATNTALFFRALARHELAAVRSGFDAHVSDPQRGRFVPVPADILAQIEGLAADDGRLGPEEAWAISLRGRDETETVVRTQEMAEAWAIARTVLDGGDEVGARMAFREAYARIVDDARRQRRPIAWMVSEGFDPQRRLAAVTAAVQAGLLPASELAALPAPGDPLLLALIDSTSEPEGIRERFAKLRAWLTRRDDGPTPAELERQRIETLKLQTAQRVADYQRGDKP